MGSAFHAERAALHRANGRDAHAARHDAAALETMPSHVLLRILELTDYNMNLFAASQRIRDEPTAAMLVARKLILCAKPERTESKALPWLAREFLQLNVHRILEAVVRGHPTTGDNRHMTPLRDAILRVARTPGDAAHDALLVRAPFFQRIATCVFAHWQRGVHCGRVSEKRRAGARELFDALRPSVERAIRSERIGDRYLYAGASKERMRELVSLVGRNEFEDLGQLTVAVVGYMRDNTGLGGSLLLRAPIPHTDPRFDAAPVTAATAYVDVYGPLCFWNTSGCTSLRGVFSPDEVRGAWRVRGDQTMVGDVDVALPALGEFSADLYWPTQNVRDLSHAFASGCFNGRVGHLNTSRVEHMNRTFFKNPVFNQPLAGWVVRTVTDMSEMFRDALSFNQPLGMWDVGFVELAHRMFQNTPSFNQPLDGWVMYKDVNALAMFRNSAFEHTMAFEHVEMSSSPQWTRGRRMKPGRVVNAASLVANGGVLRVPDGWYDENTETFERDLPRRKGQTRGG